MDAERTSLIAETYYLGVADIRDEVVWRNIDGEHKMVTRESADAEDLHIATTSVTASESLLVPAELTFVALLSSKDFWLSSDGHWTGPIQHIKNLAEVKLKCSAVAPSWSEVPVFAGDFTDVLQNMHWLMDSAGTAGITQKGIFPSEPSPAESSPAASSPQASLALRHVLFDKVYGSPAAKDIEQMENWPTNSDVAKAAFQEIKESHRVVPVPAYDTDSNLIHPSKYREALMGAVVCVSITLTHWHFPSKAKGGAYDRYAADIKRLRVLVPPTPKKPRHTPPTDPGTPTKKRRTTYTSNTEIKFVETQ